MARRAKATLWMLITQGEKSRYVSVRKVGSGRYVPTLKAPSSRVRITPLHTRRKAQVSASAPN
jgi:hypothetical protein